MTIDSEIVTFVNVTFVDEVMYIPRLFRKLQFLKTTLLMNTFEEMSTETNENLAPFKPIQ